MKILFRIFLVLCFAALAAFVWAYWYYSPERVKARIASSLAQMLDRDVALNAGRVDWSGLAIEATGVRVSERAGFGATPFLTASRAQVDFSPLPLLMGRGKLGELVLEQPVFSVVVNARGEMNAADVWRDQKFILPVDRVQISGGAVQYANAQTARTASITGIDGQIRGALAGDGIEVRAALSGQAYGGVLSVQAVATTRSDGVGVEALASLADVPVERVREMMMWDVPLFGLADVEATVQGVVDTSFVLARAEGTLEMAQGRLVQWDVLRQALAGVAHLGDLATGDVALRDVVVAFEVEGRTVRLDGTRFIAADVACRISGAGEMDGALNYAVDVDVPAAQIRLGGFNLGALMGQAATIPVRVYVRGTSTQPSIQVGVR